MKRFWKSADIADADRGWAILLDGKPVRTPLRTLLIVPTELLARAIAGEWNSIQGEIDPRAMPLTGLANAAIDRVRPDPAGFAAALAKYAQGDLVCYRAERPLELVSRQQQSWDPLLTWARRRLDVDFRTTEGIVHVDQPQATVERLFHAVSALDEFRLAGLSPLVTIGGSLVAALAVLEAEISAESAWNAVTVDELWQLEQWGADPEAEQRIENSRRDFLAAARFVELLSD